MGDNRFIYVNNVVKKYQNKVVLNNINVEIAKGEFITVIGSSGCGKTTFLKMINGLLNPDSGAIYINGIDIAKVNKIFLRRNIGYVIQEIGLFPHMTIRKNISYILRLKNEKDKEKIEKRVRYLINLVGLNEELLDRYPGELSGGQRQRVGIARALSANPDIMLMDEPFASVDEITRKLLQDEIIKIYKEFKMTVIFVTHDIKEALKLGTRVIVMDEGNIIQFDTHAELLRNPKTIFVKKLIGA